MRRNVLFLMVDCMRADTLWDRQRYPSLPNLDALKAFDRAARVDPQNAEAKAFGGWIVFLAGLTDDAMTRLDEAVAVDPGYAQARFFRGMVLVRGRDDRAGGLAELREFVRLAPSGPERESVAQLIAELEQSPT